MTLTRKEQERFDRYQFFREQERILLPFKGRPIAQLERFFGVEAERIIPPRGQPGGTVFVIQYNGREYRGQSERGVWDDLVLVENYKYDVDDEEDEDE